LDKAEEKLLRRVMMMVGALTTAHNLLPYTEDKRHHLYVGDDDEYHLKVWVEEKGEWEEVPMGLGHDPVSIIEEIAGKINHDRRRKILKVAKAPDA